MAEDTQPPINPLQEYRNLLISAAQKSQEDFDKTVLYLSGGALGISLTFLKDIVGQHSIAHPLYLLAAWFLWACSSLAVLFSYYLSHFALRRAIAQIDNETIRTQQPGGAFATWTAILNAAGAILFFLGVCSISLFATEIISLKGASDNNKGASAISPAANTTLAPSTNVTINIGSNCVTSKHNARGNLPCNERKCLPSNQDLHPKESK